MMRIPIIQQTIQTRQRSQMLDLTDAIASLTRKHNLQSGIAVVHIPHTTAGITIQENADPDVQHDLLQKLQSLVPKSESYYQHGEGNSDSHLKTAMVGSSVTLLIEDGKPMLGQWQAVYFCEFDGPRTRHYQVKLIAD